MPLQFFPKAGHVLICDFSDFQPPEMTKKRPIIVVSPKLPYRNEIVTVVPISLTAPKHNLPYVVKLSKNYHPNEADSLSSWAKCDMIMNIALKRLDRFKVGRRKYQVSELHQEDLDEVRKGIIYGLGMGDLLK